MKKIRSVFIATSSFGKETSKPIKILKTSKLKFKLNPLKRKLNENELIKNAKNYSYIIAGTEKYSKKVLSKLTKLKYIFRLGSGIENIDLNYAKKLKIKVEKSNITPEKAVAELIVGSIINLLRKINSHDQNMKKNIWKKEMGNLLYEKKVGIIGFGKVGKYLYKILKNFGVKIFINDIKKIKSIKNYSIDYITTNCDIISLNINLVKNFKILNKKRLNNLKKNCLLINTSRSGAIDNQHLYEILKRKKILGAYLDVFENEPYYGKFTKLKNILLSPHIGSYAAEIRNEMELEASNKIIINSKR